MKLPFHRLNLMPTCFALLCVLLCLSPSFTSTAHGQGPAVDDEGRVVNFERDILPIFQKRCLQCHNVDNAKGDFQIDDPEYALSYIDDTDDVDACTLWADFLVTDDEDTMMPPVSEGGPLTAQELSLIKVWILEGANWPEGLIIKAAGEEDAGDQPAAEPAAEEEARSFLSRVWAFQGYFHPATVHFPIALFLFGAFFVIVGVVRPSLGMQIPLACLWFGALTSVVAAAMGWAFAAEHGYGSWSKVDMDSEIFWHRWSGIIVSVLSVIFSLVAFKAVTGKKPSLHKVWKLGLLVLAGLVGLVGHQGGELVYGKAMYTKAFELILGPAEEPAEETAAAEEPAAEEPAAEEPAAEEPAADEPAAEEPAAEEPAAEETAEATTDTSSEAADSDEPATDETE